MRHQAAVLPDRQQGRGAHRPLVGNSAPQLAEECVGQMELFYSGPVWYLDRHPEGGNDVRKVAPRFSAGSGKFAESSNRRPGEAHAGTLRVNRVLASYVPILSLSPAPREPISCRSRP